MADGRSEARRTPEDVTGASRESVDGKRYHGWGPGKTQSRASPASSPASTLLALAAPIKVCGERVVITASGRAANGHHYVWCGVDVLLEVQKNERQREWGRR